MAPLILSITGAVLPTIWLLRYFYKKDVHREPGLVILKTFVYGVLITFPTVAVAYPVMLATPADPWLGAAYMAFLCAAIPEECLKFLVLMRYSARHSEFNEPMDGVVYGVTASLGFATLENILYVLQGGLAVAVGRALTAVPAHACFGAIMGYYVGQSRFRPGSGYAPRTGLLIAILLHGLYDFPPMTIANLADAGGTSAIQGLLFLAFAAVVIVTFVWTKRIVARLRNEQLEARPPIENEPA